MNKLMFNRIKNDKGFIAALDQSGGSTPRALKLYGINEDAYKNEEEMFDLVHKMRTRIIKSKAFNKDYIIGAILFEQTMDSDIDGKKTADFLWEEKNIVPFLKVDKGLSEKKDGVKLMNDFPRLENLLDKAIERNIFGTKMRSVIYDYNEKGIKDVIDQQFDWAKIIINKGLVPIIEPEVDINSNEKEKIEIFMKEYIDKKIKELKDDEFIMFKFTLPEKNNLFEDFTNNKNVIKVVALSGGYSREESNRRLRANKEVVASFSRALTEGLKNDMSDAEFNKKIEESIKDIYDASIA